MSFCSGVLISITNSYIHILSFNLTTTTTAYTEDYNDENEVTRTHGAHLEPAHVEEELEEGEQREVQVTCMTGHELTTHQTR